MPIGADPGEKEFEKSSCLPIRLRNETPHKRKAT